MSLCSLDAPSTHCLATSALEESNPAMRLTKIVATIGPVSRNEATLRTLIGQNASVFRFNYSHAEYDELEKAYKLVRQIGLELDKPIAILSDLQGPKFRVGFFEEGESVMLTKGERVSFVYSTEKGNAKRLPCNVAELVSALNIGSRLLLDDGNLELTVIERISPEEVVCEVQNTGILKERKGVNVPDIVIPVPALTEKDKHDCKFALEQGTDFLALSFVQTANDVRELRAYLAELGYDRANSPKIVSKIEKPQALASIDEILEETDAIMVARGDLGVELKPEFVPSAQKMLIHKANAAGKPVITATQMLESMIKNPVPTRAEVSDVANAIFDGTDAVMTSAETASGQYPVQTFEMMVRIAREAEANIDECRSYTPRLWHVRNGDGPMALHETVAHSAVQAAKQAQAKAIVVFSASGSMAARISKAKPDLPIFAVTPSKAVYHQINLLYGVQPLLLTEHESTEATLTAIDEILQAKGLVQPGTTLVFCAGQTALSGLTNSLQLFKAGEALAARA